MVPLPSDNIKKCIPVNYIVVHAAKTLSCACLHVSSLEQRVPIHLPQKVSTILSVQPCSSFVAYIAPHTPIHVLPPNSGRPPPFLPSNLDALPPTDLSYHFDVRNPQIHSIFEVGEYLAYSNPNVQGSSFSLGIAQQQLKGLRQQIATTKATLGMTSNTPIPVYYENLIT